MELQETAPVRSFASLTSAEAAERLKCDVQAGLSSSEAEQRLTLHGPNCARRTAPPALRAVPDAAHCAPAMPACKPSLFHPNPLPAC